MLLPVTCAQGFFGGRVFLKKVKKRDLSNFNLKGSGNNPIMQVYVSQVPNI